MSAGLLSTAELKADVPLVKATQASKAKDTAEERQDCDDSEMEADVPLAKETQASRAKDKAEDRQDYDDSGMDLSYDGGGTSLITIPHTSCC